ncbi:MAG: gamma-glutamyl-gamma-aminobutyrate hydrolase family protein [Planctomycetota bacterium]
MPAPLIAINCSYEKKASEQSILNSEYYDSIINAGGLPIALLPVHSKKDISSILKIAKGLVLVGSDDIPPHFYGDSEVHPKTKLIHQRRLEFDFALFRIAWKTKIPVLAICGGMQEVNVARGGTLHQDIPSLLPDTLHHTKKKPRIASHRVDLVKGTLIHSILKTDSCITNSYHHQCVKNIAPGLMVSAVCEDGVIEAIEPVKHDRFILAVQWHPERMRNDKIQENLFKAFVLTATQNF